MLPHSNSTVNPSDLDTIIEEDHAEKGIVSQIVLNSSESDLLNLAKHISTEIKSEFDINKNLNAEDVDYEINEMAESQSEKIINQIKIDDIWEFALMIRLSPNELIKNAYKHLSTDSMYLNDDIFDNNNLDMIMTKIVYYSLIYLSLEYYYNQEQQ